MVIFVDGTEPFSCIGGTNDVQDIDSEQDISTPVDIAPSVLQNPKVQTPELAAALTIHRQRVTTGERNALLSRNQAFEANIGRKARGCAD